MREKLKSLTIVLLILLLFFNLFLYTSFLQPEELKQRPIEITGFSLGSLIRPVSVSYRDERGVIFQSSLGETEGEASSRIVSKALNELMISPYALLDEAYEEKYNRNSLRFEFDLKLDIKALISLVAENPEHKALQSLKLEGELEELILPPDLKTLVFKIDGLYYEVPLLSELRSDAEEIRDYILRSSSVKYAYSGLSSQETGVLLPVGGYLAPPGYSLEFKRDFRDTELDALSRKVFGAGSDFLKGAVTGDGSLILVYGYGDEILYVDKQGFIQYKNNQNQGTKPASLRDALASALSFIIRLNGENHGYVLDALSFSRDTDSYTFEFSKLKFDLPLIVTKDNSDITIEVKSGVVMAYKQYYYDLAIIHEREVMEGVDFGAKFAVKLLKKPSLKAELEALGELEEMTLAYLKEAEEIHPIMLIKGKEGSLMLDYYTGGIR